MRPEIERLEETQGRLTTFCGIELGDLSKEELIKLLSWQTGEMRKMQEGEQLKMEEWYGRKKLQQRLKVTK